jgi:hypothetical protein
MLRNKYSTELEKVMADSLRYDFQPAPGVRGPSIKYSTSSLQGGPTFDYQDPFTHKTFSGDQIKIVESKDFGTAVSVTLMLTPDRGSTTLTLMLPTVVFDAQNHPIDIGALSITTMHDFSIPMTTGAKDHYTTLKPIVGKVTKVVFATSPEAKPSRK